MRPADASKPIPTLQASFDAGLQLAMLCKTAVHFAILVQFIGSLLSETERSLEAWMVIWSESGLHALITR
ncbi:hypothetical protein [Sphingomonas koreensis]|uniref:hypothetical protein n=1 Tax=Sphingomonas koreensis TaxID=93064 RepID=UPI000F7E1364|nr:hypothetical protein [Sphingomonas koreensis]